MLRNGATPIPPAMNTAGLAVLLCRLNEPIGPSILTPLPIGNLDKAFLKIVFRIRVVTTSSSSDGELAMEKVCVSPFASSGWAPDRLSSIYCPALNIAQYTAQP